MGISREQALDCFASDDLIGIGMEADAIRREIHPDNVVSYALDRTAAFDDDQARLLGRVRDVVREGAATVCLVAANYGLTGEQTSLGEIESSLKSIRRSFSDLRLQALTTEAILRLAADTGLEVRHVLVRLHEAGLDSLADDGPSQVSIAQWIEVHRMAHEAGLQSIAGMTFGAGEGPDGCVARLFAIRTLQEQTGGFISFLLSSAGSGLEAPTAVEYLRTLAISRIVLDNIEHVESSCVAQGLKVAQMALRFGANDLGVIQAEDGAMRRLFTEEDVRRVIRDAGFMPVERDREYRSMFLMN